MKTLTQIASKDAVPLELKGLPVPSLRVVVSDAVRVIETRRAPGSSTSARNRRAIRANAHTQARRWCADATSGTPGHARAI